MLDNDYLMLIDKNKRPFSPTIVYITVYSTLMITIKNSNYRVIVTLTF